MLTMLLYVLIVGLVAALLFLVASAVFGRSEELGPLPEGTTVTVLPAAGISGGDVRALRFQQVFRGYKAGEVDWALTRLAARIDELEGQLARLSAGDAPEAGAKTAAPESTETPAAGQGDGLVPAVLPATAPAAPASVTGSVPAIESAPSDAPGQSGARGDEPGAR
nr:DivIVA domain-containing protein [Nocardia yunnanensis]